jgi:hypothetical protein
VVEGLKDESSPSALEMADMVVGRNAP